MTAILGTEKGREEKAFRSDGKRGGRPEGRVKRKIQTTLIVVQRMTCLPRYFSDCAFDLIDLRDRLRGNLDRVPKMHRRT